MILGLVVPHIPGGLFVNPVIEARRDMSWVQLKAPQDHNGSSTWRYTSNSSKSA
jgi:hypothetical protein